MQSMNMFEEAKALEGTIALCHITQEELSDKLGVSQSYIANKLRLLRFSEPMRRRILDGGLTERHARAILRLGDENLERVAIHRASEEKLTVAMTEDLVEVLLAADGARTRAEICERAVSRLTALLTDVMSVLRDAGVRATKVTEESDGEMKITLCVAK